MNETAEIVHECAPGELRDLLFSLESKGYQIVSYRVTARPCPCDVCQDATRERHRKEAADKP